MPSAEHDAFVSTFTVRGKVSCPTEFPTPAEMADMRRLERERAATIPDGFAAEEITLAGIRCLKLSATGSAIPARQIIYFHGGGYIWTTPDASLGAMAGLAQACDAQCIGFDYRRAPEHPFPAPVDDALAVYAALLEQGRRPADIVFAGDSAGGGLVIATILATRERGMPNPAAALVFSPWTDLAVTGISADTVDDPIVNGAGLRMMAQAYLHGADAENPLASPLYASAEALRYLPPMLIQVGTREALLDDSRRFSAKAQAAGANVRLVEHQGVAHMWIVMAPDLPESLQAFEMAGGFIRSDVFR